MPDNNFLDTNVLLYTLDSNSNKQKTAFDIWRQGITISTQVVMEFTNICLKKYKFTKQQAFENSLNVMAGATVKSISEKNSKTGI